MKPYVQVAGVTRAIPFWVSLSLIPVSVIGTLNGGWWIVALPLVTWFFFSLLDAILGQNPDNADPATGEDQLFWYRLITIIWFPLQASLLLWTLSVVPGATHLNAIEKWGIFFGIGVVSGTIGINYAHELMHQKNRYERWLADLLLASVLYSHFRSEHLLVHHRYVGTPRDPVTARYNEGFHRFFPRVLVQSLRSSWRAERDRLARVNLPVISRANPFWRYGVLQLIFLVLSLLIGGWAGLVLFLVQAFTAIWQLELVNYIEHYGLTRKYLGDGRYEHVQPRHSWNACNRASSWLLINLQRHSDHHYKPDRRFPLLQNHTQADAPQLPHGYPVMTTAAMFPPLWRRIMNPRVRKWRAMYYPEITDWTAYSRASNPAPR